MTTTSPLGSCFISYNHADKPLAAALAAGLTALGYRVWIDEGELRIGDSLISAISQAIGQVDFLAALVSEHSIASNWCQKELSLAMTEELNGLGLTVLPCKVSSVDMPPALRDKLYIPIERDRVDEAVQRLHRDMQSHLAGHAPLPPRRRSATTTTSPSPGPVEMSAVDLAKEALAHGRRPFATLDHLGELHDAISETDALMNPTFNTKDDNALARERRITIFQITAEAAAVTMFLCAQADERDYKRALDGMRYLGQWPMGHGGSTVLLTQQQAPGLLLLAAGGVGAVSEERWDLVAHLLTSIRVLTRDGEAPLATGVDVSDALAGQTSFPQDQLGFKHAPTLLHDYLAAVNAAHKVMPRRTFEDAWERWEYLWHTATCNANGWLLGAPHLTVVGRSHNYEAQCKGWADALAATPSGLSEVLGDSDQPRKFDGYLAEVAQRAAWSTVPLNSAGALPGSGWRIDEVGKHALPHEERAAWNELLPPKP